MPFPVTSTTIQQVPVSVAGVGKDSSGNDVPVTLLSMTVVVTSGDATFVQNGLSFIAKSGAALADTVYTVTGSQTGGPDVVDTVVYSVTPDLTVPVATSLGFTAGPAEPKV